MPKKGSHGANSKNTKVPFASTDKDFDSNVVFGDADAKRKARTNSTREDAAKKGGSMVAASGDDLQKKPDTRELVSNIHVSIPCRRGVYLDAIENSFPLS